MPKSYRLLTYEERCQIEDSKKIGFSKGLIAQQPGHDRTTIYREIRRNSGKQGYRYKQAERNAEAHRRVASSVPWRITTQRWTEVIEKLREGSSPEQISGRFHSEGLPVGRQQIYNLLFADRGLAVICG